MLRTDHLESYGDQAGQPIAFEMRPAAPPPAIAPRVPSCATWGQTWKSGSFRQSNIKGRFELAISIALMK